MEFTWEQSLHIPKGVILQFFSAHIDVGAEQRFVHAQTWEQRHPSVWLESACSPQLLQYYDLHLYEHYNTLPLPPFDNFGLTFFSSPDWVLHWFWNFACVPQLQKRIRLHLKKYGNLWLGAKIGKVDDEDALEVDGDEENTG